LEIFFGKLFWKIILENYFANLLRKSPPLATLTEITKKIKNIKKYIFRYMDALSTNSQRRKACMEKWGFTCKCQRCEDETEFGTFASGVICCQCDNGTLLVNNTPRLPGAFPALFRRLPNACPALARRLSSSCLKLALCLPSTCLVHARCLPGACLGLKRPALARCLPGACLALAWCLPGACPVLALRLPCTCPALAQCLSCTCPALARCLPSTCRCLPGACPVLAWRLPFACPALARTLPGPYIYIFNYFNF
jgi:hypothetical protein